MRVIDLLRDMKKSIDEQASKINELDNKLSSEMKRLEEKLILLENRIENYRFVVENRYIPGLVERHEANEKRMKALEDSLNSFRIQWREFRHRLDERVREMEQAVASQQDYETLMRKIKGLDSGEL